jgi:hypothetical protein
VAFPEFPPNIDLEGRFGLPCMLGSDEHVRSYDVGGAGGVPVEENRVALEQRNFSAPIFKVQVEADDANLLQ